MAYAMTKRGSLDNEVTYEFICDQLVDMNAIEKRYRTIGSIAIVLQGESGGLEVYIAGSDKQWNSLSAIGGSSDSTGGLSIYICGQNEVNNGLPDISEPDETTVYLVPAGNTSGNLFEEYIYVDGAWEKFGAASIDLSNYIQKTDIATQSTAGLVKVLDNGNVTFNENNQLVLTLAGTAVVKTGQSDHPVSVTHQHEAAFYGLAKAAGQDMKNSNNAVGTYTTEAASAIRTMIGAAPIANPEFTGSISLGRKANTTIGNNSIAVGYNVTASGTQSHAEGNGTVASGYYSHAEGGGTVASSQYAHAEGGGTTASGYYSHAEGGGTIASGNNSHAEGEKDGQNNTVTYNNTDYTYGASGLGSHSEGKNTVAHGRDSHAEGSLTMALGLAAHSEGSQTKAVGDFSHAENDQTIASGNYSHAEGSRTTASSGMDHAEGNQTTASGGGSHAEGNGTGATGSYSHAEGNGSGASGFASHAEGNSTTASGGQSHAEGMSTIASGAQAHAEGLGGTFTLNNVSYTSESKGIADHTEGYQCLTASAQPGNHAEGFQTRATGGASHSEGNQTLASGSMSHAEGCATIASGPVSHTEGNQTLASGAVSHAEGNRTTASGANAHSEGYQTIATGVNSHVFGQCNIADSYDSWLEWAPNTEYSIGDKVKRTTTNNNITTVSGYLCKIAHTSTSTFVSTNWTDYSGQMNYVEIVGNGTNLASSNARALDWDGNEYLNGDLYINCNDDSTGGSKVATESTVTALTARVAALEAQIASLTAALEALLPIPSEAVTDENGNSVTDEQGNYIVYDTPTT